MPESVSTTAASCSGSDDSDTCRNEPAALRLKLFAIAAILLSGIIGVGIPLIGRKYKILDSRSGGGAGFVLAKAFAAGVILATGFVHMLDDAEEALTNECLPDVPWQRFPFSGFIAMLAALGKFIFSIDMTKFYFAFSMTVPLGFRDYKNENEIKVSSSITYHLEKSQNHIVWIIIVISFCTYLPIAKKKSPTLLEFVIKSWQQLVGADGQ